MANINPTLSAITLDANRLNTPIKGQKLAEGIRIHAVCKRHTRFKDTNRFKGKGFKNIPCK